MRRTTTEQSELVEGDTPAERSPVAEELVELKHTALRAIDKRERVPHPLFWSLFLGRLSDIRAAKAKRALLAEILD